MEYSARPLLATHQSCYEITFRLYSDRLTFENSALNYAGEIAIDDISSVSIVCDGQDKLKVHVRCVTKQNRTLTLLDNDEGNYLLTRLIELASAARPVMKNHGFSYDIDLKTAWRNGAYAFALMVVLAIATAVLFLARVPLYLSLTAAAITLAVLGFFFFKRGGYRDLIEISQLFDLEREREKQAVQTRAAEQKYIAELPPEEKRAGMIREYAETLHCLSLLETDTGASYDTKKALGMLVSRRARLNDAGIVPQTLRDEWKETVLKEVQPLPADAFSVSAKTLFRALKVQTVQCTIGGRFAFVSLEVELENTGDVSIDGALLASIRHDGAIVGTAYLPLPPDGVSPHTKATLFALAPIAVKADPQKTVVWYEACQLWQN